ncbi:MAG: hypothetical protein O7F14_09765, partial [Alphaproteobacteria bacterium]|nr:hypothetical protein [Alphaproteobacteria bacterium]
MTVTRPHDRQGNALLTRPGRTARGRWAAWGCLVLGLTLGACAPRLQESGPMTGQARIVGDHLIARDGARLP